MVQDVEEVDSRLEGETTCHAELTAHRHVPLRRAESPERVASEVALPCRGEAERGAIYHLPSRCAGLVEIERHTGNDIRTLHAVGAGQHAAERIVSRDDVDGRRAARVQDRIDRPTFKGRLPRSRLRSGTLVS